MSIQSIISIKCRKKHFLKKSEFYSVTDLIELYNLTDLTFFMLTLLHTIRKIGMYGLTINADLLT